jgi:hypothetical protein
LPALVPFLKAKMIAATTAMDPDTATFRVRSKQVVGSSTIIRNRHQAYWMELALETKN